MLENVQTQVRAQQQPWTTYFNTAIDKAGNKTVKTATVSVPYDQSGL